MVEVVTSSNLSAVNRISRQLLPTAESPTSSTCGCEDARRGCVTEQNSQRSGGERGGVSMPGGNHRYQSITHLEQVII